VCSSDLPIATVEDRGDDYLVTLRDQRFTISGIGDRFTVKTAVPKDRLAKKVISPKER